MKKILALVLALLMLGSISAFAETAPVATLSDPSVYVNMSGEEMTIDLAGLVIKLGVLGDEEAPLVALNVLGNDELLWNATIQVVGSTAYWSVDGLSHVYAAPTISPETFTSSNVDLSGIDTEALMNILMSSAEISMSGDTVSAKLPYTAVNDLLEALVPAMTEMEIPGVDLESADLAGAVAELKESNSGVNLEGSLTSTEDSGNFVFNVYLVEDGVAAEDAVVTVVGTMAGDVYTLDFFMLDSESGESVNAFSAVAKVDDAFDFSMIIMGEYQFGFNYTPAEKKATISFSVEGIAGALSCIVDATEEGDITVYELGDLAAAIDVADIDDAEGELLMSELQASAGSLIGFVMAQLG